MVLVLVKLPKGEMFISTNELHLSLVIESLFDNTNKFTDSGSVTLKIKLDKAQSKLRIEVGTFIKYYKISQLIHTQSIAN